eukprot:gene3330-4540_t
MVLLDETSLPVSLLSFTGNSASNGKALLQWQTATEENFSHFELEKSTNLQYYSKVVNVAAKGNNSNYGYTDNIGNGITYYRLKMVDKDGTVAYSNVVAITGSGDAIVSIAPNPVPSGAVLTMRVPPATKNAFWQIIGIDGKLYGTQAISTGATQVKIDTKTLAKGTYSLVYTQGNERKASRYPSSEPESLRIMGTFQRLYSAVAAGWLHVLSKQNVKPMLGISIKRRLFVLLLCAIGIGASSHAQVILPYQPEQDACGAISLCSTSFYTPFSYTGPGSTRSEVTGVALGEYYERNTVWFRIKVAVAGNIVFNITPVDPIEDYDYT